MDLTKLTADAKLARAAALTACEVATDGGSANLDATVFHLQRYQRAEPVVAAFANAGLSASPVKWLGSGVMVQPPGTGQGGKREASNEALCQHLRDAGWPVNAYHQMD